MIPRIIHYCWFGGGKMPHSQRKLIRRWRKLHPDFKIIRWDESNFDIDFCPYVREAYKNKKWAFVADVARLFALSTHGGIYMDTDVEVIQPLDRFLCNKAFSGIEIYQEEFERDGRPLLDVDNRPIVEGTMIPCCGILSAVIGCEPENPLIVDCLNEYMTRKPYNDSGTFNSVVIDGILANNAVKYGFRYEDTEQRLPVITIYKSYLFSYCAGERNASSVTYHHSVWSWKPQNTKQRLLLWIDKNVIDPRVFKSALIHLKSILSRFHTIVFRRER